MACFENRGQQVVAFCLGHQTGLSIIDKHDRDQFGADVFAIIKDVPVEKFVARAVSEVAAADGKLVRHLVEEQIAQAIMNKCSVQDLHGGWFMRLAAADDQRARLGHPVEIRFFFVGGIGQVILLVLEGHDR